VVYIQPENFGEEKSIISFEDIIKILQDNNDEFSGRFLDSLEKWR
jgi:hypothetical protein